MTTISPETPIRSTFFDTTRVPGLNETPDTFVDKPSIHMRAMGLYYLNGTVPTQQHNALFCANSRCAGVNSIGGRLWTRIWTHGWARWLWNDLIGCSFTPAEIGTSRRQFCFDDTSTTWSSGSDIGNARTATGFLDLSRFGFGSYTSTSYGPGGGVAMDGSGNAFAQYTRNMVAANLPSDIDDMFGTSGEYADGGAFDDLTGDSKFLNSVEATMNIYYLKGPGFGTWRWEHVTDNTGVTGSGTFTPGDPSNTEIDSSNPTIASHSMTASDSIVSKTFTFDTAPAGWDDVVAGMVMLARDSATSDFVALGVIDSKTSTSFTLKFDLENNPSTGDDLYFGSVEIAQESYTMPTTTDQFRGVRVTNLTSINLILGFGAIRSDGEPGFIIGTHGWSGAGYQEHLDNWPRDSWFGELCALAGIDLVVLHNAEQSSSTDAMIDTFPGQIVAKSPATEIFLAGDAQNGDGDTSANTYATAILGQTNYAGGTVVESQFTGDWWAQAEMGHKDNAAHPNMIGHAESVRPFLNMAASLSANANTVDPITRAAALVLDLRISSDANSGTNYKGVSTIPIAHNTVGPVTDRLLLRFKRPSRLRAGCDIPSSTLTLNFSSGAGVDDADLIFAAIKGGSRWTEDATWDDYDGSNAWDAAGGDYENVSEGTLVSPAANGTGDVEYDIRRVIEKSLALNPNSKYIDILVRLSDEASIETATINAFADDSSTPDSDAPALTISFFPPDPPVAGGTTIGQFDANAVRLSSVPRNRARSPRRR